MVGVDNCGGSANDNRSMLVRRAGHHYHNPHVWSDDDDGDDNVDCINMISFLG